MPMLAMAHDLARHRRLTTQRAAQLANDTPAAPIVEVHVLSSKWCASTIDAALAPRLQLAHAAAKQEALELFDVGSHRSHRAYCFRHPKRSSSRPAVWHEQVPGYWNTAWALQGVRGG